jgi:hypothetical protein
LLALLPLLAWRAYARIRRMVGRQRLSRVRPWITLTVFPLLIALLCLAAAGVPRSLAWMGAGLAAGALLGVFGLRRTTFEPTPQGLYYTPNAHLGVALSLLFIARIAYRFVEVLVIAPAMGRAPQDFAASALTLAVFGLLAGYYIAYAIGILRWRWRVLRSDMRVVRP